jgi:hypothetical protein
MKIFFLYNRVQTTIYGRVNIFASVFSREFERKKILAKNYIFLFCDILLFARIEKPISSKLYARAWEREKSFKKFKLS